MLTTHLILEFAMIIFLSKKSLLKDQIIFTETDVNS